MMTCKEFDTIIKKNLISAIGYDCFGYEIPEKESYCNYYNNAAFEVFKTEMMSPPYTRFFDSYRDGDGSELKERNSRYGLMPPKMASVASSSRFCYLALRDGTDVFKADAESVSFECGCPIDGLLGNAPQLDARIGDDIFIEAKCHEIFTPHRIKMKSKYWDYIFGKDNDFGLETQDKVSGDMFEIPLTYFDIHKKGSMFDVKQFLCHLLGISCQKTPAKLVYLFFKPKTESEEEQKKIEEVFVALQEEIKCLFQSAPIRKFCGKYHIQLMAVAEYDKVMGPLTRQNLLVLA